MYCKTISSECYVVVCKRLSAAFIARSVQIHTLHTYLCLHIKIQLVMRVRNLVDVMFNFNCGFRFILKYILIYGNSASQIQEAQELIFARIRGHFSSICARLSAALVFRGN